ncbi:membrane protein [Levilactobacillus namurensis]|nr:threonine/serine exporter family protein [Levilactobacillus namurensis]MCW3777507.1 threonine/serine exporter family protein [Levilactobacillus namurensis]MDT7018707.1 threonine/serine exporter family protein [Levilactobacillus namurensis]WNN66668.1 threonine/serine exporter family protein [Levilactobacillus namurensis]GEO74408.1 membrane protein [Levilactobacillus namurensis]HJE44839.1 threonine/serine exporter family protein [Levilactobacillus namurensis]
MDKNSQSNTPREFHLSQRHHMAIPWKNMVKDDDVPAREASLQERASLVGRIGITMLSCGTGAWRVRDAMDRVARSLNLTCSADIGLISLSYTCFNDEQSYTQVLSLPSTGVNTDKLNILEELVKNFQNDFSFLTVPEIHTMIDKIQTRPKQYAPAALGFAAALACTGFIFLLGGGLPEMLCTFIGAGLGNYVRALMGKHATTTIASTAISVAVAGMMYMLSFRVLEASFGVSVQHEAGYIGAMLFVIPGFPFITSMLDISKQDMRSGLERLSYAIMITTVATLVGWLVASGFNFRPADFLPLGLSPLALLLLRLPASFCGVYGFSMMFNSSQKMAITAGCIGAVANTLRLELVQLTTMPPAAAAFFGALTAGLIASLVNRYNGYPRITLTVPAIVIMVPGLYIYRAIYNIGSNQIGVGSLWLTKAVLIIMFLPVGLFVARALLDKEWRHFD